MPKASRQTKTPSAAARRLALMGGTLFLAAIGAVGCSENPSTSPAVPLVNESLAPSAKKSSGGTSTHKTAPTPVPEASIQTIPAPVTGVSVSRTVRVTAARGGFVTAGRHTVYFAAGALSRDTDITVVDMTGQVGHVECELLPEGIQFNADVWLFSSTYDLTPALDWHVYWMTTDGAGKKVGVDQGGELDQFGSFGILAHLQHFSKYRPGKAGW